MGGVDHVALIEEGKPHLQPTVRRAGRTLVPGLGGAKRVRTDNEVLVGVERAAWPDHVVEKMMVLPKSVVEEDGVVLRGVQGTVRDVRDLEVTDDPSSLELEIAEPRHLVRRLTRPVGVRGRNGCCERHRPRRPNAEGCPHAFSSFLSSSRKRQSVPWAMIFCGLDLIIPASCKRSARKRTVSSGSSSRHLPNGISFRVWSARS